MNEKHISNLHATLKSSFMAVKDDITKLKKRDVSLKEEIAEIKKSTLNIIPRDEFFTYVKKVDEQMARSIDIDTLSNTEEKISHDVSSLKSNLNSEVSEIKETIKKEIKEIKNEVSSEITGLKDKVEVHSGEFESKISSIEKDFSKRVEELKAEIKKSEELKKELKEIRNFKKQLSELEEKFAKKKALDECYEEHDEIYEILEDFETKVLKKKELEPVQKTLDEKLVKFRDQIAEVELVADKLNKKLKEIDEAEISIKRLSTSFDKLSSHVSDSFDRLSSHVSKIERNDELKDISSKLKENKEVVKAFEKKLNEFVEIFNEEKEMAITKIVSDSYYKKEDEENFEPKYEKNKEPVHKESYKFTPQATIRNVTVNEDNSEKKKGFLGKIVDWFFEEVPEDEEEVKNEKKVETKSEIKPIKVIVQPAKKEDKRVSTSTKTTEKKIIIPAKKEVPKKVEKEIKIEVTEKTQNSETKKGFFAKVVDWFLEEEPENEEEVKNEKVESEKKAQTKHEAKKQIKPVSKNKK